MNRLERFRGHFYNWYDTRDLRPLDPKYVSSVDSGNLAGHLIALGNACREMIDRPVVGPRMARRDRGRARAHPRVPARARRRPANANGNAEAAGRGARRSRRLAPGSAPADAGGRCRAAWRRSRSTPTPITDIARTLTAERGDGADAEVLAWAEAVRASIQSHQRDLEQLMPWARLVSTTSRSPQPQERMTAALEEALRSCFDSVPTLADLPDRCDAALVDPRTPPGGARGADRRSRRRARASRRADRRRRALRPRGRGRSSGASSALAELRAEDVRRDGVRLSLRPRAAASLDRLPGRRRHVSIPAATTCWPPRRAWRASSRSPRATCRRGTGSGSGAP